jgi:hypothetical protein
LVIQRAGSSPALGTPVTPRNRFFLMIVKSFGFSILIS